MLVCAMGFIMGLWILSICHPSSTGAFSVVVNLSSRELLGPISRYCDDTKPLGWWIGSCTWTIPDSSRIRAQLCPASHSVTSP